MLAEEDSLGMNEGYTGEPYTVYTAGGIFTQHDLTTNVHLKKAVWQLSKGKFALILPQSKELRDVEIPDLPAYIRNMDLLQVTMADLMISRFDGLELDAGTLIEFMLAKQLGKPVVILRSDFRQMEGGDLESPYNLMVKNWPRTVEVHFNALMGYIGMFGRASSMVPLDDSIEEAIAVELDTVEQGVHEIAHQLIDGLEAVLKLPSPFPKEYREMVYRASRFSVGAGYDDLLTEEKLNETIQRLRSHGTL
jgi:nucleoside 2-deoxyribosyltransferase